ncbi:hypothetical protein [Paenibacillus sp. J2TS4]|uniref:hypothetical protein n=1 Tax=Paenibacillus sp. J2TS4 TaxID=2807194 RepID=UPI001B190614|nr:hypothetical protein [Paenibacillus sp. J2TS4]GIP31870.1 hypothetical protein J2TS4_10800 [Paenibacillus sp. J2TS4]
MLLKKILPCALLFLTLVLGGGLLDQYIASRHFPDSSPNSPEDSYILRAYFAEHESDGFPPYQPREYVRIIR